MTTLLPAEYLATTAKIAKINARARRRGFTGTSRSPANAPVVINHPREHRSSGRLTRMIQ